MKSCEFWAKFWQCLSTGMWTESVWCDFPEKKVSKLHPIRQIWQCYLTNFSGWIIREFAVLTMAAATARAGLRTPMALYRYSFGLHLIWNQVFEPFYMDLWWNSQSRECQPRSGFKNPDCQKKHSILFSKFGYSQPIQTNYSKFICFWPDSMALYRWLFGVL